MENRSTNKVGPANFCNHDRNFGGTTVWTPFANVSIRRKNREKYSFITAILPQVLCTKRFFTGTQRFYWGTVGDLGSAMDNRSKSYY